ncbi:MAG: hypothetical protein ABNH53_04000 [Henriciella sp.]
MSNAPPQAHPNWMLKATPKGWHYTSHPIWMRLSSVSSLLKQSGSWCCAKRWRARSEAGSALAASPCA